MALHFGKRDNEPTNALNQGLNTPRYGANSVNTPASSTQAESRQAASAATSATVPEGGSKLTVGPNIKLKGVEITDCDTLVVEGLVEATMDSRVIQIAQQGAFKGSAEIDIAEIHGVFDGNLTVRQKLVIYATGKVTGKIRYGKVVIEEGGQLSGDIECSVASSAKPSSSVAKPSMALAA
ncbi:bactofilin family protein [Hydrogenophaga pseudoflava]|uniref:bactofilin family protein n=1 Tax=Hydrogenophaga pseudoflava TaxID=47421 RepID=UPI0027E59904|nr:polymer-forming cytoskeletal protein [Hydrogenophaga pseudoflava]MDQ7746459.1 polymer-forming cytoskeletal protein [Hydrogenophaga pseudoflava]